MPSISAARLKQIIREEVSRMQEADPSAPGAPAAGGATATPQKAKPGKAAAGEVEGQVDVSKIAKVLNVDGAKLRTAVANIRADKRNPADNAIFGDVFAALLKADANNTVTVMNVLKKVSAEG